MVLWSLRQHGADYSDIDDVHECIHVKTIVDERVEQEGFPSVIQASRFVLPIEQAVLRDINPCITDKCLLNPHHVLVIYVVLT
jgi:hypothetical protein